MVEVALCIGSNSGDRRWYIGQMESMLSRILLPPVVMSAIMETEPVGVAEKQPWYLNRIIGGRYDGSAFELLAACNAIEKELGRKEKGTGRKRTADIDILLFGKEAVATAELTIPHKAILSRRFCLEGLHQIMPYATIGNMAGTVKEHYENMASDVKSQSLRLFIQEGMESFGC